MESIILVWCLGGILLAGIDINRLGVFLDKHGPSDDETQIFLFGVGFFLVCGVMICCGILFVKILWHLYESLAYEKGNLLFILILASIVRVVIEVVHQSNKIKKVFSKKNMSKKNATSEKEQQAAMNVEMSARKKTAKILLDRIKKESGFLLSQEVDESTIEIVEALRKKGHETYNQLNKRLSYTEFEKRMEEVLSDLTAIREMVENESNQITLYDLLGVSPQADKESMEKAYRHLLMVIHPDVHSGNGDKVEKATSLTKLVNEAYKRL